MIQLEFYVLGSARVSCAGKTLAFKTKKSLGLLVYLLLEPGWHSRDALAALLWPNATEEDARASLRNALAFLNKTLAPAECLHIERERIGFDFASGFTLDLTLLETAFKLVATVTPANLGVLADAASALQGELLEGLELPDAPEFENWLEVRRESVHRQVVVVLERLAQLQLEGGDLRAAIGTAQRWQTLEPHSDTACRHVMQCAMTLENPKLALEFFDSFKLQLEREIGVTPEPQTLALADRARSAGRRPRASKTRAVSPEAPMVGRALEHAQLAEAFHASRSKVVLVEGEAGIGKTRLVQEFMAWARAQGARVLHGRSFATSGRLPYQPVIEIVRGWLEPETDPLESLSETWLGELSLLLPELREHHPDLPVPTVDESVGRSRLFESVARLVLALCAQGPMLVFVDDLQWTDTASLDVLHYVIRRVAETSSSLLVVFTVRSEALPITSGLNEWLEHVRHDVSLEHIELKSLDEQATRQWLASVGQNNHALETFARWLFSETQGQPLFIAQTIKNLLEQGTLKSHASTGLDYSGVANGEVKPELAPGVREVIRARINRLGPSAFALLCAGAVLGQDIEFGPMCQVAGLPESDGLTALDEVLTARLLLEAGRYRFTHDKIRDVTYTEAGDARRKVFHRRALETLERMKAPTETQTLASHEFMAVRAHHALAANQWAKAFHYSVEAAAETPHSLDQVRLEHGLRARALLREPPEGFDPISDVSSDQRIELYEELTSALAGLRQYHQAEDTITEMLEYARSIGDARLEIYALPKVATELQSGQDHQKALLEEALAIAERIGNRRDWIYAQNRLMHFDFTHWRHQAALQRGTLVLPMARAYVAPTDPHEFRNITPLIDCIRTLGQAHKWFGQWDEALSLYQEEEALLRAFLFHRLMNANCRLWQGALLLNIGRIEDSLELGRMGMETYFELTPDNPFNSVSSNWYSRELMEHGDLIAGLEVATRGFDLVNRPKTDAFWRVGTYWNQAYALFLLGQLERPLELTRVALKENEVLIKRNAWGLAQQDCLASFLCTLYTMRQDWEQACQYAVLSTKARFEINSENAWNAPRLGRNLEIEAFLRGGEIELARESVRRLGEFAGHYVRRRIAYLRALSVLDVWDGNLEFAINHLLEARALMIPIGLPNERWTLEAKLAELYEARGDLEQAREAQRCAIRVVNALADRIPDESSRTVFLEFSVGQIEARRHSMLA